MGVVLIPNQLVKLYKEGQDFNTRNKKFHQDSRTFCQLVKQEQTTMFQLKATPEGDDLLTNGNFTAGINDWVVFFPTWQWSAGQLQGIVLSGSALIFQSVTLTTNTTYALTIDIDLFSGSQDMYLQIAAQSGELHALKITKEDYGSTPGVFTMYFNSAGYTDFDISITVSGNEGDLVYINSISLYKLTEPTVTLETCTGDLVRTLSPFARGNDRITYAVEWFGLDDGCYRICLSDIDDVETNFLDKALALQTEGGEPIELEQGGYLKWFG